MSSNIQTAYLADYIMVSAKTPSAFIANFQHTTQPTRTSRAYLLKLCRKVGRALTGNSRTGLVITTLLGIGIMAVYAPDDTGTKIMGPGPLVGVGITVASLWRHARLSRRRVDAELIRTDATKAKLILQR